MLAFLPTDFWLLMLAFGFMIAVLIIALVIGERRRRDPKFEPPRVGFTPHWHLLLFVGAAIVTIVGSILVPFVTGFLDAWRSR
jgi:ABC-type Fe3+-siderophore transport system permease subunit